MEARSLVFEAYDPAKGWRTTPRRRFDLLWASTHNQGWRGGDDKALRSLAKLYDALEGACNKTEMGEADQFTLKPEGASVLIGDGEYDLIKEAWNAYKGQLPNSFARERLDYEAFLADAKVVPLQPVS